MQELNEIIIYTDGSANNATKDNGGYGIVIVDGDQVQQFVGGSYINTTSPRMELLGVIQALKKCNVGRSVKIYCDNAYVVNCITQGWMERWEGNAGFGCRANRDLLIQYLQQYRRLNKKVELIWIKGHAGNEGNELADELARIGSKRETIIKDR